MKKITKILSLLLAAAALLGMAACGGNGGKGNTTEGPSSSGSAVTLSGFIYVPSYFNMPEEVNYVNTIDVIDGKLVFNTDIYDEMNGTRETVVYTMTTEGVVESKTTVELDENSSIQSIAFDPEGGFWAVLYTYNYDDYYDDIEPLPYDGIEEEIVPEEDEEGEAIVPEAPAIETRETEDSTAAGEYHAETLTAVAVPDRAWSSTYYGGGGTSGYSLVKFGSDGRIENSLDLTKYQTTDWFYVNYIILDGQGNLFFTTDQNIYAIDPEGKEILSLSVDNWVNSMVRSAEGDIYISSWGETGMEVRPIDLGAKKLGEALKLEGFSYNLSLYSGRGYSLFLNDGNSLFGYDADTGETKEIVNWIDSDINVNSLNQMVALDEDTLVGTGWDDFTNRNQITIMSKTPASEVPQKIVLSYYCTYLDYDFRSAIINFNKTNPSYRIKVTDYSTYNSQDNYSAGLDKLNADIATGKIPDLLSLSELPVSSYASKGLLLDLYTMIDKDSELGRNAFVPGVLEAMQTGDKLYSLAPSFAIQTFIGKKSVVGDTGRWNIDEMMAAYRSLPEGAELMRYMTKENALFYFLYLGMNEYVNYETGQCSFDSPEFIKVLELANSFPKDYNYDSDEGIYEEDSALVMDGRLLLANAYFYSFDDHKQYRAMYGDEMTYIGMPTESGSGSAFTFNSELAISSKSKNVEGAWEFMKFMFSEEYQDNLRWMFPLRLSAFDKLAEKATKPDTYIDENGEEVEYEHSWYINGVEVKIKPLEQKDIDYIKSFISSVTNVAKYDSSMMEIITEETGAFFEGQKSSQETAKLIQNRISIYINENR